MNPLPFLTPARRTRSTCFTPRVEAAGVRGYTVYNRMLLATYFQSTEEDYHHLKRHVQVWDVACERQVELRGPDARALAQKLTPRSLLNLKVGQCLYVPLIDQHGGMLNDPMILMLEPERYWLSIADSDVLLWVKGLALGLGMNVEVFEPDVSPLAVQGPKADQIVTQVLGETARSIRFFGWKALDFKGHPFVVSRSGYSHQGGYEIYVDRPDLALELWDALMEAGQSEHIRAGTPNLIERIEAGLLSYGNDMTMENTPYECGLEKYCNLEDLSQCVGGLAMQHRWQQRPRQCIRGLRLNATTAGERLPGPRQPWPIFDLKQGEKQRIGQLTSCTWSPNFQTHVAIAMVAEDYWHSGAEVTVHSPVGPRLAQVCSLPFTQQT